MTTSNLKSTLQEAMKDAMRAGAKERLGTIRLILAAIKQREVDERIELSDEQILAALDKMLKQRRESIAQYEAANREDLACKEAAEIQIIQTFLPVQLTAVEIESLIKAAIAETGAASARDMGKVMGVLKPQLQGRADIGSVSNKIKELLSA
jgi:uncharacterized protein YqeY